MTFFRKMTNYDDITQIARGIYETDEALFNQIFEDKKAAIKAIKMLINNKHINEYHRSFITVIYDESPKKIEGFIVSYKGRDVSMESTFNAFEQTELTSVSSLLLNKVLNKFFTSKIGYNDYYIGNLYVFKQYRNKGHGSRLVEKIKQQARQKNTKYVILDLDYDKKGLLKFFKKLGFEKDTKSYHKILGTIYGHYRLTYEINL